MSSTAKHAMKPTPGAVRAEDVLLATFPVPGCVPVPYGRGTVGRAWLEDSKVLDEAGKADLEVSDDHLSFERTGDGPAVRDRGSFNGTWLNGRRIPSGQPVPLPDRALLRIGRTLFVFRKEHGLCPPELPLADIVSPFGLRDVRRKIEGFCRVPPRNVLIEGETGTGKELLARRIAVLLRKEEAPYGRVNVKALTEELLVAELSGRTKGGFTGATDSPGLVLESQGGTVFFDEIGELSSVAQAALLRLVEKHEVQPVGRLSRVTPVDFLLVAATNRSLAAEVKARRFRQDLRARFDGHVALPPLRDRREDIPQIVLSFKWTARGAAGQGSEGKSLLARDVEVEALEALMLARHDDNVRSLSALVGEALRIEGGPCLTARAVASLLAAQPPSALPGDLTAAELAAAREAAPSHRRAAEQLGLSWGRYQKMRKRVVPGDSQGE